MTAPDEYPPQVSLDRVAKTLTQWIGIGGAIFGVLSFCMLLGMWFGPLRDMPTRFDNIMTQLAEIKSRMDKTDWAMDALKSKNDSMVLQLATTSSELRQIRDDLRKTELTLAQLSSTSVQKVEFVERMAELEKEKTLPVLKKLP